MHTNLLLNFSRVYFYFLFLDNRNFCSSFSMLYKNKIILSNGLYTFNKCFLARFKPSMAVSGFHLSNSFILQRKKLSTKSIDAFRGNSHKNPQKKRLRKGAFFVFVKHAICFSCFQKQPLLWLSNFLCKRLFFPRLPDVRHQ
jgi:hypothetical protein